MANNQEINTNKVIYSLDLVRNRPAMFVGTLDDRGLFNCALYIYAQAFEEYMKGSANFIEISLLPNNCIRIANNGSGIPKMEATMTVLVDETQIIDRLSVVNALSAKMKITVHRDGEIYTQEYLEGKKISEVKTIGKTTLHGTIFEFEPDKKIFKDHKFNYDKFFDFIFEQHRMCKGLGLSIVDFRNEPDFIKDYGISDSAIFVSKIDSPLPMKRYSYDAW